MATGEDSGESKVRNGLDLIVVIVLAVVTVLTAWCGYESAQWGSEMSIASSQASALRLRAADAAAEARDWRAFDLAVWIGWVEAVGRDDTVLVEYAQERFPARLKKAFEAWDTDGRKEPSPLSHSSYITPGTEQSEEISAQADARFDEGLEAGDKGSRYSLLTVLFAMALFFVALSERGPTDRTSRALLSLGTLVAIVGLVLLATFPIKL